MTVLLWEYFVVEHHIIWSTKRSHSEISTKWPCEWLDTLLQNNHDACNHHKNIQTLTVEIYKIKNNLNPPIMDFMFERSNDAYNP